jgi:pyruvate/2-oxoglutarate dehydrogenase complex dihydrolipoamide acyltransferase (E2) component
MKPQTIIKRRLPRAALTVAGGAVKFSASQESGGTPSAGEPRPVDLLARTDQPCSHPYLGRIVHDMTGFSAVAERTPLDYNHDPDHVIGYAEEYDPEGEEGLTAKGVIVPSGTAHDKAAEVLARADGGVPYQCSLSHVPGSLVVEEVPEGMSTQVNNYTFAGPGLVFRKWQVAGLAICPYGVDNQTSAKFSDQSDTVEVSYLFQGPATMSDATAPAVPLAQPAAPAAPAVPATPAAGATGPASAPAAAPAVPLAVVPEGQKFLDAFGPQGGVWFAQGKSFAEAQALHLAAVTAENAQLKQRLASLAADGETPLSGSGIAADPAGEPAPASGSAAGDPSPVNKLEMAIGSNLARVAMGIRIPPKP